MALDRVRRLRGVLVPEILISVVSGAVLALAGNALAALTGVLSDSRVPLWVFAAIASVSMLAGFLCARLLPREATQAFLLVSSFTRTRYLSLLLDHTVRSLDRHGVDLLVKLPPYDFNGRSQILQMDALRARKDRFVGGLVVPRQPERMRRELLEFCAGLGLPVVFVDVRPFPRAEDQPERTAFVGCDPDEIGERAASWLGRELLEAGKDRPSLLVVGGDAQTGRQKRFTERIRELVSPVRLDVSEEGRFTRESGRDIVDQHLRHLLRRAQGLDAIYCTNDEMALGALDALREHEARGNHHDGLMVVGVDGTPDALAAIKSGTPFRATIVQDTERIADIAVDLLLRMGAGERVPAENSVPTTVYPPR